MAWASEKKANLDGVVEGCLALNVLCIDIRPVLQQELAELNALHAVDQARASVVVGSLDVRIVGHLNSKCNQMYVTCEWHKGRFTSSLTMSRWVMKQAERTGVEPVSDIEFTSAPYLGITLVKYFQSNQWKWGESMD